MSNVGSSEILIILLITAIVIGPKNMKPLIRAAGKGIRTIRKYVDEFKNELDVSDVADDLKKEIIIGTDELSMGKELEETKAELNRLEKDLKSYKKGH